MMDYTTEAWVQLNDDRTPLSMDAIEITKRILKTSQNPDDVTLKRVYNALLRLKAKGLVDCRTVKGSKQKVEWFSREKIESVLYPGVG